MDILKAFGIKKARPMAYPVQKQSPSEGGPQRWRYQPTKEIDRPLRRDASPEERSAYAQGRKRSSQVGEFASMGGKPGGTITLPSDASPESIQALRDMSAQAERQRSGMGEFKDAGPMDYKTQNPNRFSWDPDVKVNPNTGVFQTHPRPETETAQRYLRANYNFAPSGSPSTQTSSKKFTPKTPDTGGMSNQGFEDTRTLPKNPKFRYR